jgi:lipopolysaccharide export system ATP-binding protein
MNRDLNPMFKVGHRLFAANLSKSYHRKQVVRDVSIDLHQGEIVGLLGRNGAGKTTSFGMIVGLVHPDQGRIYLDDQEITGLPLYQRARKGIGYLAQEPTIFRGLTVRQNILAVLEYQKDLSRADRLDRLEESLERIGLSGLANQVAATLSGGEKRRQEIARALATQPHFILLDEPFSGVDPIAVGEIQGIIKGLRNLNIGILITDHSVRETLEVTNRSYIIHEGEVIKSGVPAEIVNDPEVRRLYLGEQFYMRDHSGLRHDA